MHIKYFSFASKPMSCLDTPFWCTLRKRDEVQKEHRLTSQFQSQIYIYSSVLS